MSVDVFHLDEGPADGPAVVLSGSIGSTIGIWDNQRQALRDNGFRVIGYEPRGHGNSPVPDGPYTLEDLGRDGAALLDMLGVARVHWVGVSIGGATGLWLAIHRPDLISTLVAAFSSARPGNTPQWNDRAALARRDGMSGIADGSITRWVTAGWRIANPEKAAWLREMTATTPPEGYAGACEALATMNLIPDLPRITAPVLAIAGEKDPAFTLEHAKTIADQVPGARLELLEDAAHLGNYEQYEEFNRLVLGHIRGR
jgi:3-oxoadipate enol-lactonase